MITCAIIIQALLAGLGFTSVDDPGRWCASCGSMNDRGIAAIGSPSYAAGSYSGDWAAPKLGQRPMERCLAYQSLLHASSASDAPVLCIHDNPADRLNWAPAKRLLRLVESRAFKLGIELPQLANTARSSGGQ
jgi:hypothetical protein